MGKKLNSRDHLRMIKFTWWLLRRFHHLENFLKFLKNVSILNWFEFDFFYCWFDVRKIVSVLNVNFVIFMIFAIFRIFKNPNENFYSPPKSKTKWIMPDYPLIGWFIVHDRPDGEILHYVMAHKLWDSIRKFFIRTHINYSGYTV